MFPFGSIWMSCMAPAVFGYSHSTFALGVYDRDVIFVEAQDTVMNSYLVL